MNNENKIKLVVIEEGVMSQKEPSFCKFCSPIFGGGGGGGGGNGSDVK